MIEGQAPLETFDEIDSTILEARRRASRGDVSPVWLLARRQTLGRGRRGRVWTSFEGNLHATYLFATTRPLNEIALLGFATSLALGEVFEHFGVEAKVSLKWPNDVMLGGAKAAGILIDSGALGGGGSWVALGIGVNISAAPKAIGQPTTSLREALPASVPTPKPAEVLAALQPRLQLWSARLAVEGFEPVRQAWSSRAHGLGQAARVELGAETLEGSMLGISPRGELELETATGRRLISAGDVFFPGAA